MVIAGSPPLRLWVHLTYESLRQFLFRITH